MIAIPRATRLAATLGSLGALVGLGALAGCGRIGYDELATDGADDGFLETPCDTPVLVTDLGPAVTPAPGAYALDVTRTATGFVAIWYLGGTELKSTGLAVNDATRLQVIQTAGYVADATGDFAVASLGDLVELAIDDGANDRTAFVDLSEYGYSRGATAFMPSKRSFGHGFITADPGRDQFLVAGVNGTSTFGYTVDHDGDLVDSPIEVITGGAVTPEGIGAVIHGNDYVYVAGTTDECTVVPVDDAMSALAPPSRIAMTCHNVGLATPLSSPNVVAAWNCDNDAVWTTGGDPRSPLPGEHAVFGDSAMSASDPRVAVTRDGVWYVYRIAGGRLGRALLDAVGDPLPGGAPSDRYQSVHLVAHDLVSRDDIPFLFWLESSGNDSLWAMRLCAP